MHLIFTIAFLNLFFSDAHAQQTTTDLKFAFITDIHFGKDEYNDEKLHPAEWLKEALEGIQGQKAEIIFVGGDIIDEVNLSSQYDSFDSVMNTNLPWYPMPGNHDIGSNDSTIQQYINRWINRGYGRGNFNREFYGFNYKGTAFYILNTQLCNPGNSKNIERSEMQIAECDSFFLANKNAPVKIILSHFPLFGKTPDEENQYFNIPKPYRKRILEIMKRHDVKYYIAGHQHINNEVKQNGITIFMNTALSFQLGSGNKRGYYIFSVTGNELLRSYFPSE